MLLVHYLRHVYTALAAHLGQAVPGSASSMSFDSHTSNPINTPFKIIQGDSLEVSVSSVFKIGHGL